MHCASFHFETAACGRTIVSFSAVLLMWLATLADATNSNNDTSHGRQPLSSILPDTCIFSGRFEQQKTIAELSKPLLSSGQIFFSCHYGLIWQHQQPFEESMVYTLKQRHFRITDTARVIVLQGQQHKIIADLLINLLSADSQAIYKDFTVLADEQEDNETTLRVVLVPESRFLKHAINTLSIEKSSVQSIKIELLDNLKQLTVIQLNNLKALSPSSVAGYAELCRQSLPGSQIACEVLADPEWYSIDNEGA